jgi:outer membrane lipoprotein carrier protein
MKNSHKWTLIVLVFAGLIGSRVHAQDMMRALNRAEVTYHGIETLRAEFSQTLHNPMLGGDVKSAGILFLAPPSRFAMRFTDPVGDRIVSDGTWLWIYLPSSVPDQVMRQPIPTRGAATPNLLAQFVDRPLEHYRAHLVGTDSVAGDLVDVVSLLPRRDDDPFREAEVSISRATGLVRRLMVIEPAGQRRTILFERLLRNVEIPNSELEFVVPAGARIVTP